MVRINALYDAELERLRSCGAAPQSLGLARRAAEGNWLPAGPRKPAL